jgi:hypothetical protein
MEKDNEYLITNYPKKVMEAITKFNYYDKILYPSIFDKQDLIFDGKNTIKLRKI